MSESHRRLEKLFAAALELAGEAREDYLRTACEGDEALRARVERLLAADTASESPVDEPALARLDPLLQPGAKASAAPRRVGSYEIVGKLGEGGMGVVYEATQPSPRRRVALKLLRPGVGGDEVMRRFQREAEILGRLRHEGIAHVYETGVAEVEWADGRTGEQPFLAMERVRGEPLGDHAARRGLPIPDRLALLAAICDAVEHAHEHGVVHRDLKPGNLLVTERGLPKVLDFGVARLVEPELQTRTLQTHAGQVMGTLAYMSPEQVSGRIDEIDARSDVYSLGAVGYELLTGALPHEVAGLSLAAVARTIQESEPIRPSARDVALRGDLETILEKALAKEPERRYPSAAALAADLRRHLAHEPILARPPSTLYQLGKFARRHPGLVYGTAATVLTLFIGIIGTAIFAVKASGARKVAEASRDEALAINDFLIEKLLLAMTPGEAKGREVRAADVFDEAGINVEQSLPGATRVGGAVRHVLGRANAAIDRWALARRWFESAWRIRVEVLGADHADTLDSQRRFGGSLHELDAFDEAHRVLEDAAARSRRALGPEARTTLDIEHELALVEFRRGDWESAERRFRGAMEARRRAFGPDAADTLESAQQLARTLARRTRFEEAERLMREVLARRRERFGADDTRVDNSHNDLASLLQDREKWDEAEALYGQSLAYCERVYGTESFRYARAVNNSASFLQARGRKSGDETALDRAEAMFRRSLDLRIALFGERHTKVAIACNNLGLLLLQRGRHEEADPLLRRAVALRRALQGESHAGTLGARFNLAVNLWRWHGDPGLDEFAAFVPLARASLGGQSAELPQMLLYYGYCLLQSGHPADAEPLLREAFERGRDVFGPDGGMPRTAARHLVTIHEARGDTAAANLWRARESGEE